MVYRKRGRLIQVLTVLAVCTFSSVNGADKHIFSTWESFESDKCASIWLIKRFIAPEAQIRFYPPGETITEGIAFDTPEARFRRYHNKSTFETLLAHYRIEDKTLIYLGRVIHDIEVNIWEKKLMPESLEVESTIREIISRDDIEVIASECRLYFDRLYEALQGQLDKTTQP